MSPIATIRSIFDYVSDKCYNGLFAAAQEYFEENWQNMSLYSRRVPQIDEAELIDGSVQRVYVTDLPGDCIAFDVGFELQICVSSADHHGDRDDECYQWLRISCQGDLAQGLDDWKITGICVYDKRKMPENSMSDALVPYIRHDKLESVAHDFLEAHYSEALKIPRPGQPPVYVDPMILADRLKLKVRTQHIKEDASVFGQIFFVDTDTEMYDAQAETMVPVHVDARTIVVDPEIYLLRNIGSVNNTIIHECVHWDKHRKVFLLEKLYNNKASSISCEVVGGAQADVTRQATEKMEQQANQLTPRIQMPAAPFKARANDLISRFMRQTHASHEIDVMEAVIEQLVLDFHVSKQAAKIRLVELGIEAAVGTFTYVDGHYVRPHSYRKGAIARNQTFTISEQDAAIQRLVNPALHSLTADGDYLFIENHYVYYSPLYVERDENGHLQLTGYALSHMDECCLVFDMSIKGNVRDEYHTICYLNREPGSYTFDITFHDEFKNAPQARQIAIRKEDRAEELRIRKQMTDDPEQCMDLLLKWRNLNYTELAAITELSTKTISRTVKGETTPKAETGALLCFGMNLPPSISSKLMEVLRCPLSPIDMKHMWISEALAVKWPEPLEDVKAYLGQYDVAL